MALLTWWTSDVPLHSFVFCQFLIGLPFFVFSTYVVYQIQVVGYLIGTDVDGGPCTTYCIVPWLGSQMDLNSVILYLNALQFGLGGALTLFLTAYSDFWARKHLIVTIAIVCYGALSIPVYWLQATTNSNFQVLTGLYVSFNVVTLILMALLPIYIPHCMRTVASQTAVNSDQAVHQEVDSVDPANVIAGTKRRYGFRMSIFATVGNAVGGIIVYVVVIILSQTLSGTASQSSGLLVTTIVGFITIGGSAVAFFGLPAIPSKPASELKGSWTKPIIEFFMPFKNLVVRKNMAALLISYTIYTDSVFAISSNIGQLFYAEIRPDALEFSLFWFAQSLALLFCTLGFLYIRPLFKIGLETWLIIGYGLILVVPVWAFIGLAENVNFGFKARWEFYAQHVLFQLSGAFVNASFRVLFSEMIPVGSEVQWFGMQLVLSCSTVWVNYVASGPLQNATHQLRFPMIISLVFLIAALVIEICRVKLPIFAADRRKWYGIEASEGLSMTGGKQSEATADEIAVTTKA